VAWSQPFGILYSMRLNAKIPVLWCGLLCTFELSLVAQSNQVRPEWVKADEDFLASDALQGRGSATRDEQIAATYIASQFESFGLKPLPNTAGYVQPIELSTVQLDGKAQLAIGKRILHEGTDFYISSSPGTSVKGSLQIVPVADLSAAKPVKSASILIQGPSDTTTARGAVALLSQGASLVIVEGTKAALDRFANGGSTRVPVQIKGIAAPAQTPATTLIFLKSGVMPLLKKANNRDVVSLVVHATAFSKFTYNAMAILRGNDPDGGTILITAHLDHLGIGAPVDGDSIYNGANDDASGTTAVLEIARALAGGPAPRRSILFVCFGSEEAGGFGARWFRENPPVPLGDIAANLEFEMIGVAQDKVPTGTMFLTGWERSNLGPTLKEHGARLSPDPFPEQSFFRRSDNYALALKGVVAHTAAAGGAVPTYHKPNDDIQHIDISLMTELIESMVEPLRWLANSNFKPAWNPGGRPAGN
jgi:aminopeptidase YwaD